MNIPSKAEQDSDKVGKLTPEQAAILASASKVESDLVGQIMHDENGNLIEPVDEQAAQASAEEENADLLNLLIGIASPALPFLSQCYTPEVVQSIAAAYTKVEEKYGWNARGMIGCEFALGLVAIPPTILAYVMGKKHFAELKAQRELAEGQPIRQNEAIDDRSKILGAN